MSEETVCCSCGQNVPKEIVDAVLAKRDATPPALTEQARQLVKEWLSDWMPPEQVEEQIDYRLVKRIASFAAEAAAQGQIKVTELEAQVRSLAKQNRELKLIIDVATDDDPGTALSKLHKLQHEAATAALEQAAKVIKDRRSWYGEEFFGPMPSMENATESEKRLVTLASANMARHTCDHLLAEIAAIGDDKEQQR